MISNFFLVAAIGFVVVVICFESYFFYKNWKRIEIFKNIFPESSSFELNKKLDVVTSITISEPEKNVNDTLRAIIGSINSYLQHSGGGMIDYNILKETVDRHCDSLEDEINSQMPVPIYCGLAGTMSGVVCGLAGLLFSGSITGLMDDGNATMSFAANGINDLLSGVAVAMLASFCGIFLSTLNTWRFRSCREEEERKKNEFLKWIQSVLLPELPNDMAGVFNILSRSLNRFNDIFKNNSKGLGDTLDKMNVAYDKINLAYKGISTVSERQADTIEKIEKLNISRIAKANITILNELENCTGNLEQFNIYLQSVQGYTAEIENFRKRLASEGNMIVLLQEIKDSLASIHEFFDNENNEMDVIIGEHKKKIGEAVDNVNDYLGKALENLGSSSNKSVGELKNTMEGQRTQLDDYLKQEQQLLVEAANNMRVKFEEQLERVPGIAKQLEEIAKIPEQLEGVTASISQSDTELAAKIIDATNKLSDRVENSNQLLAKNVQLVLGNYKKTIEDAVSGNAMFKSAFPAWLRYVIILLLFVIAGSCCFMAYSSWKATKQQKTAVIYSLPTRDLSKWDVA